MAAAFSRSASETSSDDRFAADRALRGEETLLRWAADDEAPVPRRPPGAVALVGVDVGVGEPEPRVWAPGGMERRLRGLDKFAGGGFREEDIVTRRTGGRERLFYQ